MCLMFVTLKKTIQCSSEPKPIIIQTTIENCESLKQKNVNKRYSSLLKQKLFKVIFSSLPGSFPTAVLVCHIWRAKNFNRKVFFLFVDGANNANVRFSELDLSFEVWSI
jgi:hypothetical protein